MKRVKVLIVMFVCMAVMGAVLVMGLLAKLLGLTAKWLTIPAIAIQLAAIDLSNTVRGWLRRAVR